MNVLPMPIIRSKQDAVITRDRMRIDIEADFYVRVQPTREAVSIAARRSAGARWNLKSCMRCFRQVRFRDALGRLRNDHGADAREARRLRRARQGGGRRGRWPRTARIGIGGNHDLDQTVSSSSPVEPLDAEGLTQLMEDIGPSAAAQRHRTGFDDQIRPAISKPNVRRLDRARERDPRALSRSATSRSPRPATHRGARERALRETEAEQAQISPPDHREARIANEQRLPKRASPRNANPAEGNRTHPGGRSRKSWRARKSKRRASRTSARSTPPVSPRTRGAAKGNRATRRRGGRNPGARTRREGPHPARPCVTDAGIANEEETRRREIERTRAVDAAEIAAGSHREGPHRADNHCERRTDRLRRADPLA